MPNYLFIGTFDFHILGIGRKNFFTFVLIEILFCFCFVFAFVFSSDQNLAIIMV